MASTDLYSSLSKQFGADKVFKPDDTLKYFTAQSCAQIPAIHVLPESAEDVSIIIKTATEHQQPFAVKSGGHGVFAGASSISGGLLIDLARINKTEVADDRKSAWIGAGAKWGSVYEALNNHGLSIPGGRISSVGVGGLTLGGGISFAANRYGLACDNVKSYEVVLASGEIIQVTTESHPDLFFALRGAGTNFGVVTRFQFVAFEQTQIWGGVKQYFGEDQVVTLLDKFCHDQALDSEVADIYAEAFVIVAYVQPLQKYITTAVLSHGATTDNPPVFEGFNRLQPFQSSTKVRSVADLCIELNANNPHGLRSKVLNFSVTGDAEILLKVISIYREALIQHKDKVKNFVPALLIQPLLPRMLPDDEGSHTLGVSKKDGPLYIICLLWSWTEVCDDELAIQIAYDIRDKAKAAASSAGRLHRYVYLNYADSDQDVFASYGESNLKTLLEVSKKYDPNQIFTRLRPGYIKVARSAQAKESACA
ncbi:hypothetical protein PV08_07908 [Exophiala spinifera]|uniref:FAD-binding PCMH-type domain-containing protein n=1 Tax=Exophiala spinifera TaxID=91928 RepID=A0A0D1YJH3_9EURO|nr:uncharacterized protein PV08_07908 [Exophiala spinifera]KIW15121.1 hypothetical protein PV08_07908 [Exophiala spinifera]